MSQRASRLGLSLKPCSIFIALLCFATACKGDYDGCPSGKKPMSVLIFESGVYGLQQTP